MAPRHTLGELAEQAATRFDDHDSLFFEGVWHRSATLADRSRRAAGGLAALGVSPGDRVVILMANCPEVGIVYTACWRAGAVATPVVFLVTAPELRHVLADSGAVAVVTTPEFLPKVTEAAAGLGSVRHVLVVGGTTDPAAEDWARVEDGPSVEVVDREESDLAALLYTGGTTGRSKGVMLSHANLWSVGAASSASGFVPGLSSIVLPLPLSHAYGLIVTVLGMHTPEPGRTVLMRWFDPAGWVGLAAEHRVSRSALVPSMLGMVLAQPLEDHDLSALRYVTLGAAPLARELADEFERRVPGVQVMEGYGCTESSAVISTNRPGRRRLGTVGEPLPGLEVRVVDDAGVEVPVGDDGEITVRGPGVMAGYWNSEEATAVALQDGWLHTGDIGRLSADGYLQVVDRKKDLIIRGGFNVYPRDVEDVLLAHPGVALAAVVGRPDREKGEEVVAYVQLAPGASVTVEELQAHARAHLSAVKYPREIHLVDTVPLTSVGKLDRKALRG